MEKLVATIPKSARDVIRVALTEFSTKDAVHQMISARVFFEDGPEHRPGRNGINLKVTLLPALIEALQEAEREARAAGLLPNQDKAAA